MHDISIAIVICAYTDERWDDIVRAIDSVRAQSKPAHEIILVIDHNESLFERATKEFSATDVRVIPSAEMRGLSGARNAGVKAASADVVAFLDDDAHAVTRWIEQIADCYADAHVIGAGGRIVPEWDRGRPAWFPDELDWVVGCTYRGLPTQRAQVRRLIGCNMSFRRRHILGTGGFNTGVGQVGRSLMRGDDTEFSIRLGRSFPEARIVYEPNAVVYHHVPPSRTTARYFINRCYSEGVSKAEMARHVGTSAGLHSEWPYVTRILPLGIARSIGEILCGDLAGAARASTIVAGLAVTSIGYLRGRLA